MKWTQTTTEPLTFLVRFRIFQNLAAHPPLSRLRIFNHDGAQDEGYRFRGRDKGHLHQGILCSILSTNAWLIRKRSRSLTAITTVISRQPSFVTSWLPSVKSWLMMRSMRWFERLTKMAMAGSTVRSLAVSHESNSLTHRRQWVCAIDDAEVGQDWGLCTWPGLIRHLPQHEVTLGQSGFGCF